MRRLALILFVVGCSTPETATSGGGGEDEGTAATVATVGETAMSGDAAEATSLGTGAATSASTTTPATTGATSTSTGAADSSTGAPAGTTGGGGCHPPGFECDIASCCQNCCSSVCSAFVCTEPEGGDKGSGDD